MRSNGLTIFVEGSDDARFVNRIIRPLITSRHDRIDVVEYAQLPHPIVRAHIRAAKRSGDKLLFLRDLDRHPCVTSRMGSLLRKLGDLAPALVYIVVTEIEGWYLAGVSPSRRRDLGFSLTNESTDTLTWTDFDKIRPRATFISETALKVEVLKDYDVGRARRNNRSFRRFFRHEIW
jgi:hypothetical protein